MLILAGVVVGLAAWFLMRIILLGVYTVDQNERAVKIRFGRAVRVPGDKTTLDDPIA
jgi:regulator of protease activity HflC (stomatin/prohibitin superfamily)